MSSAVHDLQMAIAPVLLAISLAFFIGCSDSKVVLQSEDGSKKLVYDPNNFQSQAETPEEIGILLREQAKPFLKSPAISPWSLGRKLLTP